MSQPPKLTDEETLLLLLELRGWLMNQYGTERYVRLVDDLLAKRKPQKH